MMWGMVFIKFTIFCAHALRSAAVIKIYNEPTDLACFQYDAETKKIHQGPWNQDGCLGTIDYTLLILSAASIVGVFVGVAVSFQRKNLVIILLGCVKVR